MWAPKARSVELCCRGRRVPMATAPGDWFVAADELAPGTRYGFSVDGGPVRPDPSSLWQPDGVHGLSAIVDPAILRRGSVGVDVHGRVGYEVHIGTFTPEGTFDAAIGHLDHLVDVGVAAVGVMPVADFPGDRGWGYDGVGLYAVHRAYGGPAGFARFIDACHERGLGVILDVVYNHLGPEGNYLAEFGPYFTPGHMTPWGPAINLDDHGNPEVRSFILGNARQWLVDYGVDALRLDAVHALVDSSPVHLLAELAQAVAGWRAETGRPLRLIAESDLNQPAMVTPLGAARGALGMDAQWDDDVHHALHAFLTGEQQGYYVDFGSAEVLAKALTRVFIHDGGHSTFRDRPWGAPVDPATDSYDGHSFVVSLQNHDQVGNRAAGDRIGAGIDPVLQAAGAALYLLGPFTGMLFMGEEWAASTPFPFFSELGGDLGAMVTQGRAEEFQAMEWADVEVPDPQASATRDSAVLRWDEISHGHHARMLEWYRRILRIRRDEADTRNPRLASVSVEVIDADTIEMRRGRIAVWVSRGTGRAAPAGARILAAWPAAGEAAAAGPGVVVYTLASSA
ncbi:MAG: malto-oligosyltrehalose trehalohydrolase [Arachnia sp.]